MSKTEIIVRYAETDRMGVVYHANYLVWMEVGRTDYLAGIGFPYSRLEEEGVLFPTSDVSLRILRPSYYEDTLIVVTELAGVRSRKVKFNYRIMRDGELMVAGSSEHICTDSRMRVKKMPQPLYEALRSAKEGDERFEALVP